MEMKNPPPMMTEKMPTTKPPTRSTAASRVSSQGASALIHERSITVLHRKDSTPLNYGRDCALPDFDPVYVGSGSKPAPSFSARMSPSAGCGHGPREQSQFGAGRAQPR